MSQRRLRLIEAISHGRSVNSNRIPCQSERDKLVCDLTKSEQLDNSDGIGRDEYFNEAKLRLLENWEVAKRNAIEKLLLEMEVLQSIESKIEERERELDERGVTVTDELLQEQHHRLLTEATKRILVSPANPSTAVPSKRQRCLETIKIMGESSDGHVIIGPNGTTMSKRALESINWSLSGAAVTRKILMEIFDREILASHTLTGKPSPAFMDCDKPSKNQLDPAKVADIIHIVTANLDMSAKEVRNAITTKCADENKMQRQREKKRLSIRESNELKDEGCKQ